MSKIGNRRTRIDIIEVTSTPDAIGGFTPTRSVVKSTWASMVKLRGTRAQEFQAVYNKQPITLNIRTGSYPITTNNLIVLDGKDYVIHSITTDPLKKITEIMVWGSQ